MNYVDYNENALQQILSMQPDVDNKKQKYIQFKVFDKVEGIPFHLNIVKKNLGYIKWLRLQGKVWGILGVTKRK